MDQLFMHSVVTVCWQAGTVANRPVVTAANTPINATILPNAVQAPVRNIVMRPTQSNVVRQSPANAVHPAMSVVGGRIITTSTNTAAVTRPAVPANASGVGMFLQKQSN